MENELYHYGVLGMKWGVKRSHSTSGGYKTEAYEALAKNQLNYIENSTLCYNIDIWKVQTR